jgi:RNA-splicing ligase RtcB
MAKTIVVLLDDKRLNALKGSGLEGKVASLFGGAIKALNYEVSDDKAKEILHAFDTARIDTRDCITDVPIAFNRVMFEEIAKAKSLGAEVIDAVFKRIGEIKEFAAKEKEYLPLPEL